MPKKTQNKKSNTAARPAKAAAKKPTQPKKAPVAKAKPLSQRAAAEAAAREGKLPPPPDFSAATHERYRGRMDELVQLANAGDIKGLKEYPINPYSTSPKAMDRYRNLAVLALQARATRAA